MRLVGGGTGRKPPESSDGVLHLLGDVGEGESPGGTPAGGVWDTGTAVFGKHAVTLLCGLHP